MKKKIHPQYQEIIFVDSSTGFRFVCGSTLKTEEKEVFEGKEYPVYRVSTSSASHPFFTGSNQFIDAEGRVDKFTKRYQNIKKQKIAEKEKESNKKKQVVAKKKLPKTVIEIEKEPKKKVATKAKDPSKAKEPAKAKTKTPAKAKTKPDTKEPKK